jgi:flagellar export protein FliJ
MKKFRFTLSALRTVRQRLEQTALEAYANALRVQKRAQDELDAVLTELRSGWTLRQDKLAAGASAETIMQIQTYCQYLEIRRRQREAVLKNAQDLALNQWQTFLAARRQREIVDRCYDHQRQRYERECAREEQKILDELGVRPTLSDTFAPASRDPSVWN